MSRVREQLGAVYDDVRRRNPAEPEFHQAVGEVLSSIEPAIAAHPEYLEAKILQRLCEPERQLEIMGGIHDRCLCAEECGAPGNYVVGANVAAFTRVAEPCSPSAWCSRSGG